eukprot:TRINITY_DN10225_c0_g1_i1.p1 TRINITY_DN10225_c0_g1~~TRINITY_DN10225_c0_g1_i1.p1  ORF type:complete len:117 (-),score=4.57 TRINITY_DN10225_c0_g1_i1:61-411(-)
MSLAPMAPIFSNIHPTQLLDTLPQTVAVPQQSLLPSMPGNGCSLLACTQLPQAPKRYTFSNGGLFLLMEVDRDVDATTKHIECNSLNIQNFSTTTRFNQCGKLLKMEFTDNQFVNL